MQNIFLLFQTMCYQFLSQRKYSFYHQIAILDGDSCVTQSRFDAYARAAQDMCIQNREFAVAEAFQLSHVG